MSDRYTNTIPFPLGMPLLVLRTTFPPKGGTKTLIHFTSSVSSPPLGGDAEGRGAALADRALCLFKIYGYGFPNPQSLATAFPWLRATGHWLQVTKGYEVR